MLYTVKNTLHKGQMTKVFLNGERVKRVIEADTLAWYIVRYVSDERGLIVVENGEAKTERLYVKVEVSIL